MPGTTRRPNGPTFGDLNQFSFESSRLDRYSMCLGSLFLLLVGTGRWSMRSGICATRSHCRGTPMIFRSDGYLLDSGIPYILWSADTAVA